MEGFEIECKKKSEAEKRAVVFSWQPHAAFGSAPSCDVTRALLLEISLIMHGLTLLSGLGENLVNALFQLNAARVNLARSTGSLNTLQ